MVRLLRAPRELPIFILSLDMSDAVNVMVYVGIPKEGNTQELFDGNHFQFDVLFPIKLPFL